jgi:salicylate hydroxylase
MLINISTPHQGAGAGMAIEDAAVLSTLLGHVSTAQPRALRAVFKAYDEVRRPRSQKLVSTSRDAGLLYEFQKEGIFDDPSKLAEEIETRFRWIWDVDLDDDCRRAAGLIEAELGST